MALAEDREEDWRPKDTFAARIALIRQTLGWNYAQAAKVTGLSDESWRHWERGAGPRNYEATCRTIASATGCDLRWLMSGGPIFPWTSSEGAGQGVYRQMSIPFRHLVAI